MKSILIIVFFVSWVNVSFSQMKAYVLRNPLKIGEQTELIYEINGEGNIPSITFPSKEKEIKCEDGIHSLEIIGSFHDTLIKNQNKWTWKGTYVVTAWDSNRFIIPSLSISYNKKVATFNQVVLNVTFPTVDKQGNIKDIKEIFTDIPSEFQTWLKKNYVWIIWSLIIIILLVISWIIYKKRKNTKSDKTSINQTYADVALSAIEKLVQQKYWIKEGEKEYYSKLSTIIKAYLGQHFQLSLSEKTSYEIELLLSQVRLRKDVLSSITMLLQQSDMVKFAKSKPNESDLMNVGFIAKKIVEETYQNKV
jgi:hypothetical protein